MRKLLYIIVSTILFASCVGNKKECALLDMAQSIINDYPDSALAILDSLEPSSQKLSEENLRQWQLLRLVAQNKCDTVFSSDSLQQVLVSYYDRHGTPNERMMAYYLLGRSYSDMGEAPRALQCFQDAIACADTTSRDCDFLNLFRIYGQLARIYRSQCMPDEELAAWNQYSHFALKSGDVYNHIRGKEMTIGPYYDLGDTVSCLRVTEQCRQEFENNGMHQEAASVFPTAIYIHLQNSNYGKAREMMEMYERESGLFDSCGNITKGREGYYYSKGLYYLGVHKNDSAEIYFRKLQKVRLNHDYKTNKGLLALYRDRNIIDSISKYSTLFEKSVDEILNENQVDAVAQASAYNKYTRFQKKSEEMAVRAEKSKWVSRFLLLLFLVIVSISSYMFVRYKKEQKRKVEALGISYTNLMSKYRQACHEAECLRYDKDEVLRDKENEISILKSQLDEMRSQYECLSPDMRKTVLLKSDIVMKFKDVINPQASESLPRTKDWELLMETIENNYPLLYRKIIASGNLSQPELQTCLLTLLHFSNHDIKNLLGLSKQRVANLKSLANNKLFGDRKAATLLENLESVDSL